MEVDRLTLGVDIDSTAWDFDAWMRQAAWDIARVRLVHTDIRWWGAYEDLLGEDVMMRCFDLALDPTRVKYRDLYPGCAHALETVYDMGFDIHFITRNYYPSRMRDPLRRWLSEELTLPFGLSITKTEDKLHIIRRVGAVGMIDDRPDFLLRVRDAGIWPCTKSQPWNIGLKERGIRVFDHWNSLPSIVRSVDWDRYTVPQTTGGRT